MLLILICYDCYISQLNTFFFILNLCFPWTYIEFLIQTAIFFQQPTLQKFVVKNFCFSAMFISFNLRHYSSSDTGRAQVVKDLFPFGASVSLPFKRIRNPGGYRPLPFWRKRMWLHSPPLLAHKKPRWLLISPYLGQNKPRRLMTLIVLAHKKPRT